MGTAVSFNGSSYTVPANGERRWGTQTSSLLIALAGNALSKAGGNFTLTADTDFGANFGLKAIYLKSRATNPGTSGVLRLGNTETITWRNAANGANLSLTVSASDRLTFDAVNVPTISSTDTLTNKTLTSPIIGDASNIVAAGVSTIGVVTASAQSFGGQKTFAAAPIFSALTASTVPYLDASKVLTSSAVTPTELGYLSGVTSAIQTQLGLKAPLASPTFTGTPAAPTAAVDTNTTQIATTAYVIGQGYAKLASPTFTGTVTLPILVGSDTTDSSSSTTGAFKTAGGLGVAKKLYVGTAAQLGDAGHTGNHTLNSVITKQVGKDTTSATYFYIQNSDNTKATYLGQESSAGGAIITGAPAYSLAIGNSQGITFSTNVASGVQGSLISGVWTFGSTSANNTAIIRGNLDVIRTDNSKTSLGSLTSVAYIDSYGVDNSTNGTFSIRSLRNNATNTVVGALMNGEGVWTIGNSSSSSTKHYIQGNQNGTHTLTVLNTNSSSPFGVSIEYSGAAPNGTSNRFISCTDSSATRFEARSNGGIANYQANDVNLSDRRTKKEIVPAKSYLETTCSIPVVTFKYNDQTHDDTNLGVIAQDVEAVAPEFVDNDGFGETPADGVPLKSIYQTDLMFGIMKAVQELKAQNDALKVRIEALEGVQ